MTPSGAGGSARVVVVGLGPSGPELVSDETRRLIAAAARAYLRTSRHPAAATLDLQTFDGLYERLASFDEVYSQIVEELVHAAADVARSDGYVAYAVPGSPLVAESTVERLRRDPRVEVDVLPALSFLDLAWARLGIDPIASGVRLVDGTDFAVSAAGSAGPLLVAQCWSQAVLSEVKLALDEADAGGESTVTVLQRLGLADEVVREVPWFELDRQVRADHLTSLWIPTVADPVGAEFVALDELGRILRRDCPWDRQQTHRSLRRHAVEEAYEVVDAIDDLEPLGDTPEEVAVQHLREELGDLLFQVVIHSRLASEEGRFTLADVARGVREKLVSRHPHVFGDVRAETAQAVADNWERLKAQEKRRTGVFEGIPGDLPALSLATELLRKAQRLAPAASGDADGRVDPADPVDAADEKANADAEVRADIDASHSAIAALEGGPITEEHLGDVLFELCRAALSAGVDPELALRARARRFMVETERARGDSTDRGAGRQ